LIAQEYKPQFHFLVSLLKHAIHGLLSACLIVLQEAAAQYTQAALEKLNELKISVQQVYEHALQAAEDTAEEAKETTEETVQKTKDTAAET